ncbi:MAG TPA: acyltransferase, partial [Allosphingosinicella sp.]|nr:acyltransferase [Allosphingosinicella sp.]
VRGHLSYLDGWRGIAILLVLVGHFAPFAPALLAGAGVEFFFVLSGRLMAEILIVRRSPLPTFLYRRASRILPALGFYVASMLVVVAATGAFGSVRDGLIGAAGAIAFFQNYLSEPHASSLFEHTWSLAVEEHSYLLLALVAGLCVRERRAAIAIALTLALLACLNGLRLGATDDGAAPYTYWRTDVRAAAIFLAFATYLWAQVFFRSRRSDLWRWLSPICAVAGLALFVQSALPPSIRFTAGTALLALAVSSVDFAHPAMRRLLDSRVLMGLGIVSFSLYLWQQPFLMLTRGGVSQIACVTLAIACAIGSYRWIEQPARSCLNRLWETRRRAPAPLAA